MVFFSTLKRNSKLALRENWGRAILALVFPAAMSFLLTLLSFGLERLFHPGPLLSQPAAESGRSLLSYYLQMTQGLWIRLLLLALLFVLTCLAMAPLSLGSTRWFRALVHGKSLPAGDVFHYCRRPKLYFRSIWFYLNLQVRSTLWAVLLLFFPGAMLLFSLLYLRTGEERAALALGTLCLVLSIALLGLCSMLLLVFLNRYMLAGYLACEDDALPVTKAFSLSVQYTRGFRFSFLLYGLTFLGWMVLGFLTLGLGWIYTGPYLCTAYAMYGRYVAEKNRYVPPNATREFVLEGQAKPPAEGA